jgi:hypothetical protein
MEDVLEVYTRPYDPRFPQVCLDETHTQLLGEVREPLPCAPGLTARHDPEYARGGVANLFLVCEPLRGWRHVTVTERRTAIDWAHCVREMVDRYYPDAEKVVPVMDRLNTHTPASLYEAFPPAEAKRLAARLEIHSTPKHGSWLNLPIGRPQRSSSACWCANARGDASQTPTVCERRSATGKRGATRRQARSTGASRRRMHASNSSISIPSPSPINVLYHLCRTTSAENKMKNRRTGMTLANCLPTMPSYLRRYRR